MKEQWKWLWRLHIPQRCKIFLWLALNDRLPTAVAHVADFAFSPCPFCQGHETLLHVLRDCPRATSVWIRLVSPQHRHAFFSCSLWDWMVTYLQQPWSDVHSDMDCLLFAATVWLVWKDRKSWVSDGRAFSSERVIHRVSTLAHDYGRVLQVEHSAPSPSPVLRYVSWCFYWNQPPSQLQLRSGADTSHVLPKL